MIGNGGGGKSTLSRILSERLRLPLYEVDAVQWLPGWTRAPLDVIAATLDAWAAESEWIIDGFGPLPLSIAVSIERISPCTSTITSRSTCGGPRSASSPRRCADARGLVSAGLHRTC